MIDEHLFRREAGRMVAALTRIFGTHNLALAEDVVQDALCRALEVWRFHGVPENPGGWLMTTAKNRALDVLRRERTVREYAPELGRLLETEWSLAPVVEELFAENEIEDDVLRMMFTCVSPRIADDAQVALILNVVSGFAAPEIAHAFLTSQSAIEKRLSRAKATLAESKSLFDVSGAEKISARLESVQRALYVLFSEGYHGAHPESAVRSDLCTEAMRLADRLLHKPITATPRTHALAALMALHAARIPGRVDAAGDLSPLGEQDRSLWDRALVERGLRLMEASAEGDALSEYHVEAAIAAEHATAPRTEDTAWTRIVAHYDVLFAMRPSPIIALNRAIAIAQRDGPERGLEAIASIEGSARLEAYPFYAAALGELEKRRGHCDVARTHFERAFELARNPEERRFFQARVAECQSSIPPDTSIR